MIKVVVVRGNLGNKKSFQGNEKKVSQTNKSEKKEKRWAEITLHYDIFWKDWEQRDFFIQLDSKPAIITNVPFTTTFYTFYPGNNNIWLHQIKQSFIEFTNIIFYLVSDK